MTEFIIPNNSIKFNKKEANPIFKKTIDYPNMTSFFHFVHQSVNKCQHIFRDYIDKPKVYEVINPYNFKIDDYDDDLQSILSKKYDTDMNDYLFFELYELRKKYKLESKSPINKGDKQNIQHAMLKCSSIYYDYNIQKPMFQENILFSKISTDIDSILSKSTKGDSLIISLYDMNTSVIKKLILRLRQMFENVFIYQPFSTPIYFGRKYLVLQNLTNYISIDEFITTKKEYLFNIYPDINYNDEDYDKMVYQFNINYYIGLNKFLVYINNQNFRGKEYSEYRNQSILNTIKWIKKFTSS